MTIRILLLSFVFVCFIPFAGFAQGISLSGRVADTQGGAVVQVVSTGPFEITYVDPKDDPRKAMAAKP